MFKIHILTLLNIKIMNGNDFSKYMNNAIQSGLQEIDNVNLNSLNKQSGINILEKKLSSDISKKF